MTELSGPIDGGRKGQPEVVTRGGDAEAVSRRQFLGGSASLVGAAVLGGRLARRPGAASAPVDASALLRKASPKRGGTLTIGMTGGSSSDNLTGQTVENNVDNMRTSQIFEPLVRYNPDATASLYLAEEITSNKTATTWTVRVRPGITFHDGKPLTADDVIYSFQRIIKNKLPGAPALTGLDVAGMKKLDARTAQIPFAKPLSDFVEVLPNYYFNVVPVDFDPKNPVGTGPFKYKSFTPGVTSTFVRYDDYWQSGLPYLDTVVIQDYATETSQVNALTSGTIDAAPLLSLASIHAVESGGYVAQISESGFISPFTMRVDVAPFNDVRVRQAMRALVDREEMLELVFGGHGLIGNDITSIWDPVYDHALPQRQQDIGLAKSLLKKAGMEDLHVQLVTADIAQGTTLAATVFAQQAKAAGVTVDLRQITTTELYGPEYLSWPFAQDFWGYFPYLVQVSQAFLPSSLYNETHWDDPTYTSLYDSAVAELDTAKRTDICHEMQRIDYEQGGYIIPYFAPVIDGLSPKLRNVQQSRVGLPLGNDNLKVVWID